MNIKSIIAVVIFSCAVSVANAQTLRRDNARIRQGVRSGELTAAERARLKGKEIDIRRDERAARADGVITPVERHEIRKDKKNLNRSIYRQKHNAQTRP